MSCVSFSPQYFNRFDLSDKGQHRQQNSEHDSKYHSLMGIHSSSARWPPGNGMIISFQLNSLGGGTLIVCDGNNENNKTNWLPKAQGKNGWICGKEAEGLRDPTGYFRMFLCVRLPAHLSTSLSTALMESVRFSLPGGF